MIKKLFIFLLLYFSMFIGAVALGQEVLTVQSARMPPYEEALKGFQSVCDADITRIIISELKQNDVIKRINRISPDIILAIGMDALTKVKPIKDIPIIYIMVLDPRSILSGEDNITGVSMNIPQERQIFILARILPGIKTIGLVYDPVITGHLVERVRKAAGAAGLNLITKEINRAGEAVSAIHSMGGEIDLLWMLPDRTVITDETLEFMLLFSLENMTPIFTFSEKYLEAGALMSISIDPFDMGSQAGEMANEILSGKEYSSIEEREARKEIISFNSKVARKLGISVDEELLTTVEIIE